MSFGDYLRAARDGRRMTLDDIAAQTKIKRHLLADLEDDDLRRWPKYLIYRHGYLRAVADALGLDRDEVLDRFDEAFPEYYPVAFDGGNHWLSAVRARTAGIFAARGAAAGIALGVAAGLIFTIAEKVWPGPGPNVPTAAVSAQSVMRQDITLPPDAAVMVSGTAGAETDAVRAVNGDDPAEEEGEVRVRSNPPGAVVTVNGIGRGRTPARIRYLPLGTYTIRVIQFGYKARESQVVLTSDQPVREVRVSLRARPDRLR